MLSLNHHSFKELPDALENYLADPNSDQEADLTHIDLLDPRRVQVTIHPLVTPMGHIQAYMVSCIHEVLGAQLHLYDSSFPRPLLP